MNNSLIYRSIAVPLCGLEALFFFLIASDSWAQDQSPKDAETPSLPAPGAEDDVDVEVEVEEQDGSASTQASVPVEAPSPAVDSPSASTATMSTAAPSTTASVPHQSKAVSHETQSPETTERQADIVESPAPFGTSLPHGKSLLSEGLEAEGSNIRRSLRRGFRVRGFVQAQYTANQISEDQLDADGESLNQDGFEIPRARLRVEHGWQYAFATLELEAGTSGGPPVRLRRAEASLLYRGDFSDEVPPPLVLTGGIFDVPFGAELGESQRDRLFMERSLPSRALFPSNADLGAKLWGVYGPLDYSLAVVNGEPPEQNGWPKDDNSAKDLTGRVGAQAGLAASGQLKGGVSFYVGEGFSPGVPGSKDSVLWVDLNNNGVVDSGEIQGLSGSSPIPSSNFSRFAFGLDVGASWLLPWGSLQVGSEVTAASNMDRGLLPNDPITSGADSRQLAASFFAVQGISRWIALGFRGAFYDPNSNLVELRAGTFHLQNQQFWELSPLIAVLLDRARLTGEYDFVIDHLGRDQAGVPSDAANNRWTVRLQVDL